MDNQNKIKQALRLLPAGPLKNALLLRYKVSDTAPSTGFLGTGPQSKPEPQASAGIEFDNLDELNTFVARLQYQKDHGPENLRGRYEHFYNMTSKAIEGSTDGRVAEIIGNPSGTLTLVLGGMNPTDRKVVDGAVKDATAVYKDQSKINNLIDFAVGSGALKVGYSGSQDLEGWLAYNLENAESPEHKNEVQALIDRIDNLKDTQVIAGINLQSKTWASNYIESQLGELVSNSVLTPENVSAFDEAEFWKKLDKRFEDSGVSPDKVRAGVQAVLDNLERSDTLTQLNVDDIIEGFGRALDELKVQGERLGEDFELDKEALTRRFDQALEDSERVFGGAIDQARGAAANTQAGITGQALQTGQSIAGAGALDPSLITSGQAGRLQRLASQRYQSGLLGARTGYQGAHRQALYNRGVRDTQIGEDSQLGQDALQLQFDRSSDDLERSRYDTIFDQNQTIRQTRLNDITSQLSTLDESLLGLTDNQGNILPGSEGLYGQLTTRRQGLQSDFDFYTNYTPPRGEQGRTPEQAERDREFRTRNYKGETP